jgi:hypothetical protein
MSGHRKPNIRRGEMAFIFAILLGLAVGILIKKVRIGILIGLILGIMIVLTGWLRSTRKLLMSSPDNNNAPFFKNWKYWYVLVIGFLVVLIVLFSIFTKRFS